MHLNFCTRLTVECQTLNIGENVPILNRSVVSTVHLYARMDIFDASIYHKRADRIREMVCWALFAFSRKMDGNERGNVTDN